MKVRDVIAKWPLHRWVADDAQSRDLSPTQAAELRLLWFSTPDEEGWFRVAATDSERRDWSTFGRIADLAKWPILEITLSGKLRASLEEIGALDLERG